MQGIVHSIPDPLKNFGFIRGFDDQGSIVSESIFYHHEDFRAADPIGRRRPLVGDHVEFYLSTEEKRKWRALNIVNLTTSGIDRTTHREWSILKSWQPADPVAGVRPLGWLERESGDSIILFPNAIGDFETIEPNICASLWICHGVAVSDYSQKWVATDAVVHFPDEQVIDSSDSDSAEPELLDEISQHFLDAEELPLDETESERLDPDQVYTASERKLTIRELIARKSAA
jgi:hypothetical protein